MWIESGDGESQPGEGVMSLSDLAAQMEGSEQEGEEAPEGEESEESEAPEQAEAEGDAEDSEDEQQEEPTFTIKVDGKDVTLKQSELIERAQKGTDYTNKTMVLAEERKAVEQAKTHAEQVRQHREQALNETLQSLQIAHKFMESQLGDPPDTALLDYDTAGYLRQQHEYEARRGQLTQAQHVMQQVQQEQARQRQAYVQDRAAQTEQALRDTLPGWNDATLTELADFAGSLGLTPKNVELAMLEPGFWQMAHEAKAYRALQAQKATLKPKAELPKVNAPRASNPTQKADARKADAMKALRAKPNSLDALSRLVD
jgi:hypothetical protein